MEFGENNSRLTVINVRNQRPRYGYYVVKRVFDFLASFCALILLSPLFLIIAIAIKVEDSSGRVFYSQIRIGKNGKTFKMYKFRSMVSNADELLHTLLKSNEVDGAMFKMKNDPRITRVGSFIRKYSLDELPQLLNVLEGNMSLVGPRPPLPREVSEYTDYDKQRLLVLPGCTGLWQATSRNNVGFDEMVYLDLRYIQQRGPLLDLKILFLTFILFFKPTGI